jgi:hypothetical protein
MRWCGMVDWTEHGKWPSWQDPFHVGCFSNGKLASQDTSTAFNLGTGLLAENENPEFTHKSY